jgi:hypothetical protein
MQASYFVLMQLPRGTFHSIKRGIVLHSLLNGMEKSRFTGYCRISYDVITCTIVLQSGRYLFADYEKLEGEPAWQKIHNMLTKKVDASLTTLNDAQINLCIEFNTHAVLPETIRSSRRRETNPQIPPVRSDTFGQPSDIPSHMKVHKVTSSQGHAKPVQEWYKTPPQAPVPSDIVQIRRKAEREENETISRDLNTLDDMDLDEMTKKIRESCKITVEQLNLEHLIEKINE